MTNQPPPDYSRFDPPLSPNEQIAAARGLPPSASGPTNPAGGSLADPDYLSSLIKQIHNVIIRIAATLMLFVILFLFLAFIFTSTN